MAIDETLYSYRGRISFKQFNLSRPAKYGVLFRSLCDSIVQLTYVLLPYAGKPTGMSEKYYVTGTDKYTKYLVNTATELGGKDCVKGRNISPIAISPQWSATLLKRHFGICAFLRTLQKF